MDREESDLNGGISAGRYVNPGIPDAETMRLQAGRFVNPVVLPRTRHTTIQSYSANAISAVAIGNCWINGINFFVANNNNPVTSIPEGASFKLGYKYHIENSKGSATDVWAMAVVWWEGDDPATSAYKGSYFNDTFDDAGAIPHPTYLEKIVYTDSYIMPARAVTFHFNAFINDDHAPAQALPLIADWTLTI